MIDMKILLTLTICLFSTYVFAQQESQDAKAKSILAEVSKKYKSYQNVKTDFVYQLISPQSNAADSQAGTLFTKPKTNKYKVVIYADENRKSVSQELISDGKTQWTYLKQENEVQVSDLDNSADAMNPAQIFTMYEKGFKYLYTGDKKAGNIIYQQIELSPIESKSTYFKIKLMIDKQKKQLYSAEILDKNGNTYKYTVKSFLPGVKISDETYSFNSAKYPGVEVVDLR